jgi:hypothetical protein
MPVRRGDDGAIHTGPGIKNIILRMFRGWPDPANPVNETAALATLLYVLDPSTLDPVALTSDDFAGPGGGSSSAKPTDAYGYSAKSITATYKYFFFEDASLNWYILRKTIATGQIDYSKGTGGYESVYVNSTSAPVGPMTFDNYGAIF